MRILLTGAGGQLAADLNAVFSEAGHTLAAYRRDDLDIADPDAVKAVVEETGPDLILNPAAYNRVDDAEREPGLAFVVNALGPQSGPRSGDPRGRAGALQHRLRGGRPSRSARRRVGPAAPTLGLCRFQAGRRAPGRRLLHAPLCPARVRRVWSGRGQQS